MTANTEQSVIRNVHLSQGESIKLQNDEHLMQEVTCDDIARMALAIHNYSNFFSIRRALKINFSRDVNGSGIQCLEITRNNDKTNSQNLIKVTFDYTYANDGEFLYEAELVMDRHKDYEPIINKGKHRFFATSADIQMDWNSVETLQWRSDIARLSRSSPETLTDWVEADLEMLVKCSSGSTCDGRVILNRGDLTRHVAAGLSLEDLKTRLTCSKCGKRQALIFVF